MKKGKVKKDTKKKARKLDRLEKANRKAEKKAAKKLAVVAPEISEESDPLAPAPDDEVAFLTVTELAGWVNVNPKTARSFLRQRFPNDAPGKGGSWRVTHGMIRAAEARWPRV